MRCRHCGAICDVHGMLLWYRWLQGVLKIKSCSPNIEEHHEPTLLMAKTCSEHMYEILVADLLSSESWR